MNVGAEQGHDWRKRDDGLDAFEEFAFGDLLNEFGDEPVADFVGDEIRHKKSAPLRLGDSGCISCHGGLEFGLIECLRELLPEGHVAGFGDFKNFTRQEALREKSKLVQKRELGRIATLHETGGDFLKQNRCGIARFERKTHLGVFDGCAVGAVGHRERRAGLSSGLAASCADVFQKSQGIGGGWRFGKSNSWTCAPLVIGSAGEDFLPWLGMRWRNARAGVENLDLSRSQRAEDLTRGLAKQSAITAIDRLEMPEEEYELLQMQLGELAIHTVKGMSHRVGDVLRKKILLQVVDALPRLLDIAVLGL